MPRLQNIPHWALLSVCLFSCAGSSPKAESSADASNTVTLNFDWPAQTGTVQREVLEKTADGEERSSVVYSVVVKDTNAGVEVSYTDPRDLEVPGVTPEELEAVRGMFAAIPSFTLHRGVVTSISNTDAMRALIDDLAPCGLTRSSSTPCAANGTG